MNFIRTSVIATVAVVACGILYAERMGNLIGPAAEVSTPKETAQAVSNELAKAKMELYTSISNAVSVSNVVEAVKTWAGAE